MRVQDVVLDEVSNGGCIVEGTLDNLIEQKSHHRVHRLLAMHCV